MFVKFTESRVHRLGTIITKFQCGEHYPFVAKMMQQYVDIGHALPCDENGNLLTEAGPEGDRETAPSADSPAPAGDTKRGARGAKRPLMNEDRAIEAPDVPEPNRDPAINGGLTEA